MNFFLLFNQNKTYFESKDLLPMQGNGMRGKKDRCKDLWVDIEGVVDVVKLHVLFDIEDFEMD